MGSCLRRNDGWGAGMVEGKWGDDRVRRDGWRWLRLLTPHLASPLEGGRDELGRGDELRKEGEFGEEEGDEEGDAKCALCAICANGL